MDFYWRYFLVLEQELSDLSRYIEFNSNNYSTYSIELARIYLAVCSEIDVVAKLLSNSLGHPNPDNICDYRTQIMGTYSNLPNLRVQIPRHSLDFTPWNSWGHTTPSNPSWWRNYNNVKHHRTDYYSEANLENVLNATADLIVLNLYYQKHHGLSPRSNTDVFLDFEMRPILFNPDQFNIIPLASNAIGWGGNLP